MERKLRRFDPVSSGVLAAAVVFVSVAVLYGEAPPDAPPGPPERSAARRILEATGVEGGLVVHFGCGSGRLTAALRANDGYVVHGLDPDAENIQKARRHIRALGLYGKVSAEQWTDDHLPYTDNLVNLLVAEDLAGVPMAEVLRVLVPDGVAYVKQAGKWAKTVKPRGKEMDEWTHFLHDADNNAVAHDSLVGPPRHVQWVGGPRWARSHEHLASVSAVVSAAGRIFYIVDEGPTASVTLPAKWFLVGRDAFNGVILWKRRIASWQPQLRGFRSGPAQLPRRLIAVGDRVYVTLGLDAPLTALDAATGRTLKTYEKTKCTEEIIYSQGALILAVNAGAAGDQDSGAARRRGQDSPPADICVMAIRPDTGRIMWRKDADGLAAVTLAAKGGRVFYKDGQRICCVELDGGREKWHSSPIAQPDVKWRSGMLSEAPWYSPTLVVYKNVVLFADGKILTALSAKSGETLWTEESNAGFNSAPDVLVADGLVWSGKLALAWAPGFTAARDPASGEVERRFEADPNIRRRLGMPHHRCYRNKATDRYILAGRAGVEFLDLKSGDVRMHHWVRGTCQYGVMPCNGLLYAPPHSCACYIRAKLNGFNALASARRPRSPGPTGTLLERGPAYEKAAAGPPPTGSGQDNWPTYRRDRARSGSTTSAVPAELKPAWHRQFGGRLTSPVIAEGKVFIAAPDAHTVYALDAGDGEVLWEYTASGRVDSPPTIHKGLALFGSADGWVYCLQASDGKLVWRFRGAREDRRVLAYGQLESAWPVHGSVLVLNDSSTASGWGVAYFAAGRSSYLDGGIWLYRLDVKTGRKLSEALISSLDAKTGRQPKVTATFELPGALPDVLSSDGKSVYMRHMSFGLEGARRRATGRHLFSPTGFLDDSWWHRSYWLFADKFHAGWSGWWRAGNKVPSGRILVFDDSSVYGFGRDLYPRSSPLWSKGEKYQLFAAPIEQPESVKKPGAKSAGKPQPKQKARQRPPIASTVKYHWTVEMPLVVRAMVLADKRLFVAGPAGDARHSLAAFEGQQGVVLWSLSATDGEKLAEYKLESLPVFDGLAAAAGRLYIALDGGRLVCFGPR
ncbi:MAG: outer membrane protein assembly factor BamB family protein [Planctomycetota bacterium]|jgi:outer membrane protein assembly factor BamB